MVQFSSAHLDASFAALADPTRRASVAEIEADKWFIGPDGYKDEEVVAAAVATTARRSAGLALRHRALAEPARSRDAGEVARRR